MKTKSAWALAATLILVGVLVLQSLYMAWFSIKILPAYVAITSQGIVDVTAAPDNEISAQSHSVVVSLIRIENNLVEYWWFWLPIGLALVALFERFVRGENKALVRLSALGSLAFVGTVVVVLMTTSTMIPMLMTLPRCAPADAVAVAEQ